MTPPPTYPLNPILAKYGYRAADLSAAPVVSVITPYYNTGRMFLETAESLLRQSLQQWEWIIVNDGYCRGPNYAGVHGSRKVDAKDLVGFIKRV